MDSAAVVLVRIREVVTMDLVALVAVVSEWGAAVEAEVKVIA